MNARTFLAAAATWSAVTVSAAEIAWETGTTVNEADVRSEGRAVFAYAPVSAFVNGTWFHAAKGDFFGDAAAGTSLTPDKSSFWVEPQAGWSGGAEYRKLLSGGFWSNALSTSFTLKGLVPGGRYLVQVWFNDMRSFRTQSKMTIDGMTQLSMDGGANVAGQYATGTFVADGAEQSFSCAYNYQVSFNAVQLRRLDESPISWRAAPTSGMADLMEAGKLHCAYVPGKRLSVRSVTFESAGTAAAISDRLELSSAPGSAYDGFFVNSGTGYDSAYAALLARGFWKDISAPTKRSATIRGLVPGHVYAIQLWLADNRDNLGARRMTIDHAVALKHTHDAKNGPGEYAVGTFTAASAEQRFSWIHSTNGDGSASGQELLGAIQVRCLDDERGVMLWTKGATAEDGSVDERGRLVYGWCGSEATVGGTRFRSFRDDDYTNSIALPAPFARTYSGMANESDVALEPAARSMLGGAFWADVSALPSFSLRLKRLVPGRRYLVQIWGCDARSYGAGRTETVDGYETFALQTAASPRGEYVVGTFLADAPTRDVAFSNGNWQWCVNALQVRELDFPRDAAEESWLVRALTGTSADVSTVGLPLYAYGAAAADYVVNDVTFRSVSAPAAAFGSDVALSVPFGGVARNTFHPAGGLPDGLERLFSDGLYDNSASEMTFSLNGLVPGMRYAVELFVADARDYSWARSRTCSSHGLSMAYYPGSVLQGQFTASDVSHPVKVSYAAGAAQLNALQVRRLGTIWSGASAGGQWGVDGAGWNENGADKTGVATWGTDGGLARSAFVPGGVSLGLKEDVWVGAVFSDGEIEIGAPGSGAALTVGYEVQAPLATVNAKWGGARFAKTGAGKTVLAGDCSAVKYVTVADGVAKLASATFAARPRIVVYAPGVLEIAEGVGVDAEELVGDGTLRGPGRIDLKQGGVVGVPSRFVLDGIAWGLFNGTTLGGVVGADVGNVVVYVDDPESYHSSGAVVVAVEGKPSGRPSVIVPASERDRRWRMKWSAEKGGFMLAPGLGLTVVVK